MLRLATGAILVLGCASSVLTGRPLRSEPVASGDGVAVTYAQLDEASRIELFRLKNREFEVLRKVLDELVEEQVLAAEALARGVSPQALLDGELAARTTTPTEEEISAAYLKAEPRFPDLTKDELVARIEETATKARRQQSRSQYMAELKAKYKVVDRLSPPRLEFEVPTFAPVEGPEAASVSVVLFSDFTCPACRGLSAAVKRARKDHPTVRWSLVHLPSNRRPLSTRAALAAECGGPASGWRFYDAIFESEGELTDVTVISAATKIGLSADEVENCVSNPSARAALERHLSFAKSLGISGTPTLFINGRMILGSLPWMELDRILRTETATADAMSEPKKQSVVTFAPARK